MRLRERLFSAFILFFLCLGLFGLLQTTNIKAASKKPALTKTKVTLYVGESKTLKLKNIPKSSSVKWSTSNKRVVTVNKGKILARRNGLATVTATYKGKKYKCRVTVKTKPLTVREYGTYTTRDEVALYLHTYRKLPPNFITKAEARQHGWTGGGLDPYARNKCIGGDYFSNYEGQLPKEQDRDYYECDIDTLNKASRGAKRLVYSNDGLIYYTADHYETFTQLYAGY